MPKVTEYLLIQNKGEAPVEGYTVLGFSSTRNCGVEGTIGQFGSGAKHAINLCLRHGLAVWVYCGKTRLEFNLEKEMIHDGTFNGGEPNLTKVYHVAYRKNGGAPKRAGWVLDFGVLDWDKVSMGLRELVSNAVDRTLKEEGDIQEARNANRLVIKIVPDSDRRAKSGFTRIYVAVNDAVREYCGNLHKNFLHFSDTPEQAKPCLILKDKPSKARIYRCGVFVREMDQDSLFDYNFGTDEIRIDECRNSSDYAVKAACAKKLQDAGTPELKVVFDAQVAGIDTVESGFDEDYLTCFNSLTETQSERWKNAWEASAGAEAVVCDSSFARDYTEKKGHPTQLVKPNWSRALSRAGIRTADDVLSIDEQRGRTRVKMTPDAKKAVQWAWELFECANLVSDREFPETFCFQEIGTAESKKSGYQNHEGVHIHVDIANDGQNNELKKTALEEVTHWITGATDSSKDFQNFLIDTLVALA